jgi:hypothetical protein
VPDGFQDRRTSARIPVQFPATWSDHFYEWPGEALNLGAGGVFTVGAPLDPGKQLRISLELPGQDPLTLDATVAHATSDGMGFAFRLQDTATFARAVEAFERQVVRDPQMAARARRHVGSLPDAERLFPTPRALQGGGRTPAENRALNLVGSGAQVRELRTRGGAALGPVLFALLERDLLTTHESRAVRDAPAPWTEPSAGPTRRESARSPAAERYFQQAVQELADGNDRAAVTSLRLALVLSPGDPQIEAELQRLAGPSR